MTYNELYAGFQTLTSVEQGRFIDEAKRAMKWTMMNNLRTGAKVQFTNSKSGVVISGIFIRMKQKYAEVESTQGKGGFDVGQKVRWSVPPDMLRFENGT